jgi:hypothetical protein
VLLVNYAHTGIHQVHIIMITQQSLVNPSSFYFKKLGWGDSWTASKSCRSKLSITGDTAKYLFLTLYRGCALFPQDSVNPFFHDAHFARMARWWLSGDLSEAIPQTNPDVFHPTIYYHPLSVWLSSHNWIGQDRAHMTCGCTGSFTTWLSPISLFLGGRPSSEIHTTAIEMTLV